MDELNRWWQRIRGLLFRDRVDRELTEEMRYHLEMETRERIEAGMDPEGARRAARLSFGGVEGYRQVVRESRWGYSLDVLVQDLRYALRGFRKSPGFTAVALLTLALGIGANAAIFSLVQSVLLRPLPYGEPGRAVAIQTSWEGTPVARISPAEYGDYQARLTDVFSAVGVYASGAVSLTGDGEPVRLRCSWMSHGTLPALGVEPALGRRFTEEEDVGGAALVLLSHALWQSRYGGDPGIVGRELQVSGAALEVIGVMPAEFRLPAEILSGEPSLLYQPLGIDPSQATSRGSHFLEGVARLAPGVPRETAAAALEELTRRFGEEHPDDYESDMRFTATALALAETVRGPVRRPLAVLVGAVGFVLLIACVNLANLLLARAGRRRRELAVRSALGAPRRRLVAQMAVETGLLALAGGALGVALAELILQGIALASPPDLAWLAASRVDGGVLLFALGLSALTGAVFGLLPAWQLGANALDLRSGPRSGHGSAGQRRARRALVVAEVAITLVLLTGAGLLVRTFQGLLAVDPGFSTEGILTAALDLPQAEYRETEQVTGAFRDLVSRLGELPGTVHAGAVTNLPLASSLGDMSFEIEGRPKPAGAVHPDADWQVVTPGYFEAIGMRRLEGRWIDGRDTGEAPGAVVINETFAGIHWPGESALGKRFRLLGERTAPRNVEVVGVVGDVRHESLIQPERPQMYFAHQQFRFWANGRPAPSMKLVVRTRLPEADGRAAVLETVRSFDSDLPVADFRSMHEVRSHSVAVPRMLLGLVSAFGAMALLLASIGLYGVMAAAVGRRVPELGLRLALGARRGQVARLVLGEAGRLVGVGLLLGLGAAALSTRALLSGVLYGVGPLDPAALFGGALLLAATALVAAWGPVKRAVAVDPARVLRTD